ncbi:AAA family ATPase [Orrella sp. 11846]|uniref:AAA family ATPase n=1 Tax=Orrella sp. 11846 TaxID=3409913 RepID=UPI003B5A7DCD
MLNHDDLMKKLQADELVKDSVPAWQRNFFNDPSDEELKKLPLETFFGDFFLALIYSSESVLPESWAQTKECLKQVSDPAQPLDVRAKAALSIGEFVQSTVFNSNVRGRSSPQIWFKYAQVLGNPSGAMALADYVLKQNDVLIEMNLESNPIPQLESTREAQNDRFFLPQELPEIWLSVIRMTSTAKPTEFKYWGTLDFNNVLKAIANYLSLIVTRPSKEPNADINAFEAKQWLKRQQDLSWIEPIWNQVLEAMASCKPMQSEARLYREQQCIVIARLKHMATYQGPSSTDMNASRLEAKEILNASSAQADTLIVLKGPLMKSNDRDENRILDQYQKLRKPLPFKTLPNLDQIVAIRTQLQAQFPWATEAIDTIMNEFLARKRFGVQRLGMAPILLAGPPGTGKTRFSQKLAELLGTPGLLLNLAGMSDVKTLKGVTRGWSSARPSRIVEFMLQTQTPNPMVLLDEVDKTNQYGTNGGNPQDALLDLLEPGNAKQYQDIYLMAPCDLSHCLYILTCNSLDPISEPLKTRLRPVSFPPPRPEDAPVIIEGIVQDLEIAWNLPQGAISLSYAQKQKLAGLSPREMRFAILDMLGSDTESMAQRLH